jgi:hypothetical protein
MAATCWSWQSSVDGEACTASTGELLAQVDGEELRRDMLVQDAASGRQLPASAVIDDYTGMHTLLGQLKAQAPGVQLLEVGGLDMRLLGLLLRQACCLVLSGRCTAGLPGPQLAASPEGGARGEEGMGQGRGVG